MAKKVNISRILFVTFWCIVGAGVFVLLGAAMRYRNNKTCKGYTIDISGPSGMIERSEAQFISRKEIEELLTADGAGKLKGKAIQSFDLRSLEASLERNPWIRDAQLFFDNNEKLRVNVIEREPVARVFTADGRSFYIDSSGIQLPLSVRLVAKLPVFTGYPAQEGRLHGKDSLLSVQVRRMGTYIINDPFWMAQIAQIDITPARTFEMAPVIGDHLIAFGDGADYEQKFHRLFVFYREVLSRTGFDKYSRINVAYAGQVIGTRKGSEGTRFDSLQGIRNIQQMIRSARQLQPDSLHQQEIRPLEKSTMTEQNLTSYDLIPDKGDSAGGAQRPKAVMPPRDNNNDKMRKNN